MILPVHFLYINLNQAIGDNVYVCCCPFAGKESPFFQRLWHATEYRISYPVLTLSHCTMYSLTVLLAYAICTGVGNDAWQTTQSKFTAVADRTSNKKHAGYFFSLRNVPLSQEQYIFSADPLKKGVYLQGGKSVTLGHTMTVKTSKGFDMYFSGSEYNVVLAIREARQVDEETITYKGTLSVQHGSEKQRFAVHGFQYR